MLIHIDQEKCCGAGHCVLAAPEVFDQRDEDGIVILLDAAPPPTSTRPSRTPPRSARRGHPPRTPLITPTPQPAAERRP